MSKDLIFLYKSRYLINEEGSRWGHYFYDKKNKSYLKITVEHCFFEKTEIIVSKSKWIPDEKAKNMLEEKLLIDKIKKF